uniref:putative methyltransferase DDB_G0268948 n=1 Tax=Styela clava TaxID=7725 RepID=UPI00193A1154|nr:putative methyltransferase DDB_G0268948 [Styela clava]
MSYAHCYNGKEKSELYAKHRPPYPDIVAEAIMNYLRSKKSDGKNGKLKKMLDVGCGGGQSIYIFTPYFESILGIDISDSQIEYANKHNSNKNVEFRIVRDNVFPVGDNSVDLIICASAVHWLDLATFETECHRVLKPGGYCAIYAYCPSFVRKINEPQSKRASIVEIEKQYHRNMGSQDLILDVFGQYDIIYDRLKSNTKERIEGLEFEVENTLIQYKNLFKTVAKYLEYLNLGLGEENAPIQALGSHVKRILDMNDLPDDEVKFILTYTYPTIMFRK